MITELNAILTIAFRDLTKLLRDRARIAANFIFPTIFIGILGTSLQSNLSNQLPYNFLTFVFTGVVGQTLFQSTASGIISLVEDRQTDFAQELFISPISRYSIVIGKILGETLVSFVQVFGVILFALVFRVPLDLMALLRLFPFFVAISFFGGAFGLMVMANLSEQRSANQIFPFLLFPQYFLAGVFNPIQNLPLPLTIASRLAPMTYAIDLVRSVYYANSPQKPYTTLFPPFLNLAVVTVFFVIFISIGTYLFVRNEKNR